MRCMVAVLFELYSAPSVFLPLVLLPLKDARSKFELAVREHLVRSSGDDICQ